MTSASRIAHKSLEMVSDAGSGSGTLRRTIPLFLERRVLTKPQWTRRFDFRVIFCGLGRDRRLQRLRHCRVTLPAFVFQFDVLDQNGIGIGIEIGKRLPFRNPATDRCCKRARVVPLHCIVPG